MVNNYASQYWTTVLVNRHGVVIHSDCQYSCLCNFLPVQPLRSLISSVGGTSVMLGLVAMATTVDNLYASMKALVCIIGDNQVALKEMERTGGFQVKHSYNSCATVNA